jgi:hypothetical protein
VDFFGVCVLYSARDVILVILQPHAYVIANAAHSDLGYVSDDQSVYV